MLLLILCQLSSHLHIHLFTFHYASTYTQRYRDPQSSMLNLHSTMLLLIPSPTGSLLSGWLYLHSTMLLLIPATAGYSGAATAFTFHYASTYTRGFLTVRGKVPDLHSTMLLLIRNPRIQKFYQETIYIPLCFYLYKRRSRYLDALQLNLHSTMLLLIRWLDFSEVARLSIYIPLCFYLYVV